MEFCCNADSLIGAHADDDTFVVRCTEAEDLTTDGGLRFAQGWVDHLGPQMGGILWGGAFRVRVAVSVMI